jgi:TRAP-type mannitol/chloroaromatic compound transport system substrate-binding protein
LECNLQGLKFRIGGYAGKIISRIGVVPILRFG